MFTRFIDWRAFRGGNPCVLCLRGNGARNILVKLAAAVTMVLSVGTAIRYFGHPAFLKITGGFLPAVLLAVDVIAAAVIFYYTLIKFKKFKIAFLELIQLAGILWFEKGIGHAIEARHDLLIDNFALIMVLIAGIIGSLIAVFSLGYMEEFQKEHRDVQDRRPFFLTGVRSSSLSSSCSCRPCSAWSFPTIC